ncbi:MAG: hypothetical protein QOF48_2220 [Verrucomicrobiota bacterium]
MPGFAEPADAPRAVEAAQDRVPAKAAPFIAAYRDRTNVESRLDALRGLEKFQGPAIDQFLLAEYGKLDGTKPAEARLIGGILRVWARHPDKPVLPFLIYEGLFHEDADVVRACAAGIALGAEDAKAVMSTGSAVRGGDPAEDLAADLIHRMSERAELLPPIEKVLALWSGRTRPGYKTDADLKRKPADKERAVAREFWQKWFEERFKHPLKPADGQPK